MNLKLLVRGRADKKSHGYYLIFIYVLFFITIAISASFYNTPFSMKNVCISNLGSTDLNHRGWWIFTIAFFFMGILLIPHQLFIYHNLMPQTKLITKFWLLLQIIADIGMVGLGIFNETLGTVHVVFSIMNLAGIGVTMLFTPFILMRRVYLKEKWPSFKSFIIIHIIEAIMLYFLLNELFLIVIHDSGSLDYAEWIGFIFCLGWLFGLYFLINE